MIKRNSFDKVDKKKKTQKQKISHTMRATSSYKLKLNYKSLGLNWFVYFGWITFFYWTNRTATTSYKLSSFFLFFLLLCRSTFARPFHSATMRCGECLAKFYGIVWSLMNRIERRENENKREALIENLRRLPAATGKDKQHVWENDLCVCAR